MVVEAKELEIVETVSLPDVVDCNVEYRLDKEVDLERVALVELAVSTLCDEVILLVLVAIVEPVSVPVGDEDIVGELRVEDVADKVVEFMVSEDVSSVVRLIDVEVGNPVDVAVAVLVVVTTGTDPFVHGAEMPFTKIVTFTVESERLTTTIVPFIPKPARGPLSK